MNYSVDIGNNLVGLGYIFLFFKYVVPYLIGIAFILAAYFFVKHYTPKVEVTNGALWVLVLGAVIAISFIV